ncbi:hydroxymyristoyl-ACP dehydratase [Roseomonas eburnea]|uniref:Hydroxymyristoyl-ACP dehydratase n=1 Tax=Neoroseomonas eburnea TaxID=1346889 RepID=A0A9X9XG93_9PROT|nr:phosphotransferase [Neoroseomonas eburnea]MBR0682729.1 hydroxymyristoyl-ACP dehydratase [Neoroseomonas eburnea]
MSTLPASREAIARLIPHQGAMCLLDRVEACDAEGILCSSATHSDAANPLRRDGMLPAICGAEYALQAMALHGALTQGAPQGRGFVAALSGVEIGTDRLDDVVGELAVAATAMARESRGFIYRFTIDGDGRRLLGGRATVVLA